MNPEGYSNVLEPVMATAGVRGALVVDVPDGLIVEGRVHVGVRGEAVAALAASLFRRMASAVPGRNGGIHRIEIEAEEGRIFIAGTRELAVLAVIERRANPGQVRLAVRRAAGELVSGEGSI